MREGWCSANPLHKPDFDFSHKQCVTILIRLLMWWRPQTLSWCKHCHSLPNTSLSWRQEPHLNWIELNWIELNWTELNWIELNWIELNWADDRTWHHWVRRKPLLLLVALLQKHSRERCSTLSSKGVLEACQSCMMVSDTSNGDAWQINSMPCSHMLCRLAVRACGA